jgi:FAD/FMN-containing dehydrogenase
MAATSNTYPFDHEIQKGCIGTDAPELSPLDTLSPSLPILTKSNPEFSQYRKIYNVDITTQPKAIILINDASDITAVLKFAVKHHIPVAVRVGGHDLRGRCMIQDGLVLDLRKLSSIQIDRERGVAVIGGGCLNETVAQKLSDEGFMTTFPAVPCVGYAGWATLGGYGLLSGSLGLGADQIVSAKLVSWKGEVVEADEELLWAMRGGGCGFGVITELRIKLHPVVRVRA